MHCLSSSVLMWDLIPSSSAPTIRKCTSWNSLCYISIDLIIMFFQQYKWIWFLTKKLLSQQYRWIIPDFMLGKCAGVVFQCSDDEAIQAFAEQIGSRRARNGCWVFLGFGSTTFGAFLGCWYMDTIVRGALFGFLEVF